MFLVCSILICKLAFIATVASASDKTISKRGLPIYPSDEYPIYNPTLAGATKISPYPLGPWASTKILPPSPSEVSNAISIAKQASANVLIAQQQVQAAKEHVLNQQRIAMEKEAAAALLTQKSETAAAVQRSEAASAAQAVVLAQQRLAAAKAAVAHQQRIASAKEAQAAAALQSSAHAAAEEIQRTEHEASKLATIQRIGAAAAAHHVSATKDAALAPLTSGGNHVPNPALSWNPYGSGVGQSGHPWHGGDHSAALFLPPKPAFSLNALWG